MQVTIIKKDRLNNFNLPKKVEGNFWITDYENGSKVNLINIEAVDSNWNIISNQDVFIVDDKNVMVPQITLKEYAFYVLKNSIKDEMYYLFCCPTYDLTYKEYSMQDNNKIIIGSGGNSNIKYKLGGIPENAYSIEKNKNKIVLNILDNNSSVYVNGKKVLNSVPLTYGDIVFMFGLKVILLRKNSTDCLYVNNPNGLLEYDANYVNIVAEQSNFVENNEELNLDSILKDNEYFYRTPYFHEELKEYSLNLDVPPTKKEENKSPALLTIGPMVTMAMTSVITLSSTINSINKGEATWKSSSTALITTGVMLTSSLLWPLLTKAYESFSDKMYERKRQKLYKKYLKDKDKNIEAEKLHQKQSLLDNYFSVSEAIQTIKKHDVKLWQRRITDSDFLTVPIGIGNLPMKIQIKYPEEHFSLEKDNLLELAYELGKKERILDNVPITYSFYDNVATGIVGNIFKNREFIDRVILQMMTMYSYDEIKFVTLTSTDNESYWNYIKILPYSWTNDKSLRLFGSSNDDFREIFYYLEKVYNERKNRENNDEQKKIPHYVIITDSIKSIDSYDLIKKIMTDNNPNNGFSVVMLVDKLTALPNECKNFINLNETECTIFNSVLNSNLQKFALDNTPIDELYDCSKEISNIFVEIKSEQEATLPDSYEFLEMYQVGKIEQLNPLERWKKSNPIASLQAPVGIGKNGELINLDLHEKYHGPHGLIAGTTGSGKSEFIITYILSLAVNYHPDEVQFILIDYKGGGLAGAFVNNKYSLPHIAGTITNLDGNELNRSLASIEAEVKRRQAKFNEAKQITSESTIDIYKYQKLYREGALKDMEPISHLFIISDEFAELKEQQPDFMEKLISVARIGRSLGVHLILATQKPSGVVDAQIWSNTKFRVCLKVQDASDSQDVLKKPDAAYLKKTGRFYLQVGYDEVYTLGQSAWGGAQYYPATSFRKGTDTSVNVINNIGYVLKNIDIDHSNDSVESKGEQLTNIVRYLSEVAQKDNIKSRKLWLDRIPNDIYIQNLKDKYSYQKNNFSINPVIGEYDDPDSQNQYLLTMPFCNNGNSLIYGIAGSGKEDFLSTLAYSCMTTYAPQEVNFYMIDLGAQTLRMFKDSPYVGGVVFMDDVEKINNLFKLIEAEIDDRKQKFANFGGSYSSYIQNQENRIPSWIVYINGYEAFSENFEDLDERLGQITRDSYKYGIYFVLTVASDGGIRNRLVQNFSLIYALEQNTEDDYYNILQMNCRGKMPSKNKGRGLFKSDKVYEFQIARIVPEKINDHVASIIAKQKEATKYRAYKIPALPETVDFEYLKDYITKDTNIIVGVNKKTLGIEKYNLAKNAINVISSYEIENTYDFLSNIINEIKYMGVYNQVLINTTDEEFINSNIKDHIITNNYNSFIDQIINESISVYDEYEKSNYNQDILKNKPKKLIYILGIYNFINQLDSEILEKLNNNMNKITQLGLYSFVIIDNPDVIKNYSYDDWYKAGVDDGKGIWIGSGVTDQNIIKINKYSSEDSEEIPNDYGYIINVGKINRIKLIDSFEN